MRSAEDVDVHRELGLVEPLHREQGVPAQHARAQSDHNKASQKLGAKSHPHEHLPPLGPPALAKADRHLVAQPVYTKCRGLARTGFPVSLASKASRLSVCGPASARYTSTAVR